MRVRVGCGNFLHRPQIVAKLIMKAKELPPVELLREWLDYDPDTGLVTWKKSKKGIYIVDKEIGIFEVKQ